MTPTPNSVACAKGSGIDTRSINTTAPTRNNTTVCPSPQLNPIMPEARSEGRCANTVDTAAKWSVSKAWRSPSTKPSPKMVRNSVSSIRGHPGLAPQHRGRPHDETSAATRVHFETWIIAKCLNTDKPSDTQPIPFKRLAVFCAPVAAALPAGTDQGPHLVIRGAGAKRCAQICSRCRVQTAVPHPVGGHPAAIARRTEWRGRRRNNPKGRPIRQQKSLRRRSSSFRHRIDRPIVPTQYVEHRGLGEHFFLRPLVRAADVHIFNKPNLRSHLLAKLDQIDQFIVIEPTNRHRIEF